MQIEKDMKFTALAIVLCGAAYAGLSHWPRSQERTTLAAEVEANKKQLGVDRKGVQGLGEMREQVIELRKTAVNTNRIVPDSSDLADVLRRLNSEMLAQGMSNQEVQTQAIVSGADFNVIPMSLRFEGEYPGIFEFVKNIETMSRLTRINRLEISGEPTKPDVPVIARLELTTFSTTPGANSARSQP